MTATAKTYDRQTAKFLARVGENMPEMDGTTMQGWIDNPLALQKALRTALCLLEQAAAPCEFKVWKTVKIGTQKSVKDLSKVLTDNGFRISDWAADILKKMPLANAETEIELVVVSAADLGFTKVTRRDAIYDRAKELGLDRVPAEVGPQLRLAYTNQPMNEWLLIAMEPIAASGGDLDVFVVERSEDSIWLAAGYGYPGSGWGSGSRWVFARRKQN